LPAALWSWMGPCSTAAGASWSDDYAPPADNEHSNTEFKCDLAVDRLSDHRFIANQFRLCLHAAAVNLRVRLPRFIAVRLLAVAPPVVIARPRTSPRSS
jgi:hypothetical protein